MLILTRKTGQSIIIGGQSKVTVTSISAHRREIHFSVNDCPAIIYHQGQKLSLPQHAATISILSMHGDQVSIGIDAPRSVSVHREEIQARIDAGVSV